MAVFSIKSFGGIAPIVPARYLQDNQAQTAMNCPVFQGSIQSLSALGASVASYQKLELLIRCIVSGKIRCRKIITGFIGHLMLMYVAPR